MSFLTEAAVRRLALTSRVAAVQTPRQFSTSIAARKSVTEAAKDTIKTVDRKVSDKLVDGINAGSRATEKVTGKATEANYKAAGSAEEIRGKMKGEAEELKGKAKGAAKEAEGKWTFLDQAASDLRIAAYLFWSVNTIAPFVTPARAEPFLPPLIKTDKRMGEELCVETPRAAFRSSAIATAKRPSSRRWAFAQGLAVVPLTALMLMMVAVTIWITNGIHSLLILSFDLDFPQEQYMWLSTPLQYPPKRRGDLGQYDTLLIASIILRTGIPTHILGHLSLAFLAGYGLP
ncbi:hypothetical protein F5Y19DRAFT_478768 [Xylariaceae sp. FL1651]|nr:hypothetical protein F5Y19DRAFT_478768 [Xylariaceae sp. FL1651]